MKPHEDATTPYPVATTLDVRALAWPRRLQRIIALFEELAPGTALELVVEYEPAPLHDFFRATRAGRFDWQTVENGPDTWRVRIARLEPR